MLEKLVSILAVDAELAGSSIAGTVTESLVHPRDKKYFLRHFLRAMTVGWLLATFVSPAIAEKLQLSKEESVAVAFIGGYAGIKLLNAAEVVAIHKITSKKRKKSLKARHFRQNSLEQGDLMRQAELLALVTFPHAVFY